MDLLTEPFCNCTLDWVTVPLRLAVGVVFVHAGYGKFQRGISGFGSWLGELGYPLGQPTARLVASLELIGGLALILGLFTHWVAIPLALMMVVATYTNAVKLRLPFAGNENAQGYELDLLLIAILVRAHPRWLRPALPGRADLRVRVVRGAAGGCRPAVDVLSSQDLTCL